MTFSIKPGGYRGLRKEKGDDSDLINFFVACIRNTLFQDFSIPFYQSVSKDNVHGFNIKKFTAKLQDKN